MAIHVVLESYYLNNNLIQFYVNIFKCNGDKKFQIFYLVKFTRYQHIFVWIALEI